MLIQTYSSTRDDRVFESVHFISNSSTSKLLSGRMTNQDKDYIVDNQSKEL